MESAILPCKELSFLTLSLSLSIIWKSFTGICWLHWRDIYPLLWTLTATEQLRKSCCHVMLQHCFEWNVLKLSKGPLPAVLEILHDATWNVKPNYSKCLFLALGISAALAVSVFAGLLGKRCCQQVNGEMIFFFSYLLLFTHSQLAHTESDNPDS